MYGVPDAISSLEQHQAVHAVVLADMVHAAAAGQQALQVLRAAANSAQGLNTATLQALARLPVWPSCLLQLLPAIVQHAPCCKASQTDSAAIAAADAGGRVQGVLVAALGDLQAAWSDNQLQRLLQDLPLPAMLLLLSSDQLRVPSEDTVLYTARQYALVTSHQYDAAAKAALAEVVRAPQLSTFALSCACYRPIDCDLLSEYKHQLRSLLSLKRVASAEELASKLKDFDDDLPARWQLGPRQITPLADGVLFEWRLPVEQLRQACRKSCRLQQHVWLDSRWGSSSCCSSRAPFGGISWHMCVGCHQVDGGKVVGLYAGPDVVDSVPAGMYCRVKATASWQGAKMEMDFIHNRSDCGDSNYPDLEPMAGDGWDDAVWAAAGLPTSGDMLLQLSHCGTLRSQRDVSRLPALHQWPSWYCYIAAVSSCSIGLWHCAGLLGGGLW
jgi:hypothetical protein